MSELNNSKNDTSIYGMTLKDIAKKLKDDEDKNNKKHNIIYAFNGIGKTRLSLEFKNLIIEDGGDGAEDSILCYNSYVEDLFSWENDENVLIIKPHSLIEWLLKDEGMDSRVINTFEKYSSKKIMPKFNENFSSVAFSIKMEDDSIENNIKISKGEESLFIWSIFNTLIDVLKDTLEESNKFDNLKYIFIDDPVSSLDENHLIELAINVANLIKDLSTNDNKKHNIKCIITTHNALFYNVLSRAIENTDNFMLVEVDDKFDLKKISKHHTFSYHLSLIQTIQEAIKKGEVKKFHFMLLRNLYEKTAVFLGYKNWGELLPGSPDTTTPGSESSDIYARYLNLYSHQQLSEEGINELTKEEKNIVDRLLKHLIEKYNFKQG